MWSKALRKQITVDSKILENHCKQKKYKLIQVMGTLYMYISFTEVLYTQYNPIIMHL